MRKTQKQDQNHRVFEHNFDTKYTYKNKENIRSAGTETQEPQTPNPTQPPVVVFLQQRPCASATCSSPPRPARPTRPARPRSNAFHHSPRRRTRPAFDLPFFGATVDARETLRPASMCVLLRQRTLKSSSHLALYAPALHRLLAGPAAPALAGPSLERGRPPECARAPQAADARVRPRIQPLCGQKKCTALTSAPEMEGAGASTPKPHKHIAPPAHGLHHHVPLHARGRV